MIFKIETTKRDRINHYAKTKKLLTKQTIKKGEKCLIMSNELKGRNSRKYNYAKNDAIRILKKLIKELEN